MAGPVSGPASRTASRTAVASRTGDPAGRPRTPSAEGDLRPALDEGVQTGTQDHVLADASVRLLGYQILDETRPGDDGRPEPARAGWVHVPAPSQPSSGAAS